MNVQGIIENKLSDNIEVVFLDVENESHRHAVPANSETHFKVTIVSPVFNEMRLIARHRLINELLKEQLSGPVHALALHTYTPQQWQEKRMISPNSADCLGGGK